MKYKSDKFIITVFLCLIFGIFIFYPIKQVMVMLEISYIDVDGNWKSHTEKDKGVLSDYYNKVESLKTALDNRTTNYFPYYGELVSLYSNGNQNLNKLIYSKYVPLGTNSDSDFIIKDTTYNKLYLLSSKTNEELDKRSEKLIKFYSDLSKNIDSELYIYLPSRNEFQENLNKELEYRNMYKYVDKFINNVEGVTIKKLTIDSEEQYHDYYFGSDHHWNMLGAYAGYQEIIDMLGVKDYTKVDELFKVNKIKYRGSLSKSIKDLNVYDNLYDIKVNLKKHTILVNDEEVPSKYKPRNIENLNKGNSSFYDYYVGYFYGLYGKVVYDFNQPDKENVLIIADSYSWQIDHLIASNFNKTHILNLLYDEFESSELNIKKYVEENNIDKVLFLQETHTSIFDFYGYDISEGIVW